MKEALAGRPVVDFPVPDGIGFAQVDRATGLRAIPGGESELEVFVKGSEPKETARPPEVAANPEPTEDGNGPAEGSPAETDIVPDDAD